MKNLLYNVSLFVNGLFLGLLIGWAAQGRLPICQEGVAPVVAAQASEGAPGEDLVGWLQDGRSALVGSPDDEDAWMDRAQRFADRSGEAVVVCQGRVFVALLNPSSGLLVAR